MSGSNSAYKLVLLGQILLYVFLIFCIVLIPSFLFRHNEGGISNYALYAKTIAPFTLSSASAAVLTVAASFKLTGDLAYIKKLRAGLRIWALIVILTLISSYVYKLNHINDDIHEVIATALLLFEIAFGGWLVFTKTLDRLGLTAWLLQVSMLLLGIFNLLGIVHLLFVIEVVGGIGFAVVLVRSLRRLTS